MRTQDLDEFGLDEPETVRDAGPVYRTLRKGGKQVGELSARMKYARELFLFGKDGKPIRNIERLAKESGCSVSGVTKRVAGWQKESESMALAETGGRRALGRNVSPELLAIYDNQALVMQSEVERMAEILPKLSVGTDLHADTLKLYVQALKSWADLSGITAHHEIALTAQKELIKQAARLKAKGEAERTERKANSFDFS